MRRSQLVAVLSLGTASLAWPPCCRFPETASVSPQLLALTSALDGRRLFEPRLTGGFGHARCQPIPEASRLLPNSECSKPPAPGTAHFKALKAAAHRIQAEAGKRPSPATLHAKAVAELVIGGAAGIERAIALLEEVTAAAPGDAEAWSDLAAAYHLRAQGRDEPRDLVRALSAVERALQADSGLAEALFNRGLICEALFLPASREVWSEYLRRSSEPDWRAEAQRRLRALKDPWAGSASARLAPARLADALLQAGGRPLEEIVLPHRQAAREYAEQMLLGEWADDSGHLDGEASRHLDVARGIGRILAARGERLVQDAVTTIDAALAERKAGRLAALRVGHRAYRKGFNLYKRGEWSLSEEQLTTAQKALTRAGSPFANRAAFYRAACAYHRGSSAESSAILGRLEGALLGRSHWALLGHVGWLQGMLDGDRDEPMAAVRSYESSLACFERIGEAGNVAAVRGLLATILQEVGRGREAWAFRYQALREAEALTDPVRKYILYATAADAALAEGQRAAALRFQDEAVRQAEVATDHGALADALFWRGFIRNRSGRRQAAWNDLGLALKEIERLPDPAARRRLSADVSMIEGEMSLASDPRRAAELLTSSLSFYQELGHNFLSVMVYRLRARAHRQTGDMERAEADLQAALAAYDRLGESLSREDLHLAYIAGTEEAFDEMIAFQAVTRRRPEAAFHFADHARTRVLPARAARTRAAGISHAARRRLLASEPRPLASEEIRGRLPEATCLVQYAVLPDRLLIWRLRREGMLFVEQPISREDLERRVARLEVSRRRTKEIAVWDRESSVLFELLIRPWLSGTKRGETIVFVADKVLQGVPFAALWNPASSRYLVEDYRIVCTPSATLYVTSGEPAAARSGERLPVLVVSNPAFDRGLWSGLTPLPEAETEAQGIARFFPGVVSIHGRDATRESFLDLARRSDRIHFAGHAVANPTDPLLSFLLLASSGQGKSGALYAWELYQMDLTQTRLVVLSACKTAGDSPVASEGTTNLARAFFAAGASQVVASLWEVDDRTTSRFFSIFYKSLLVRPDPSDALRRAQLSFLASREASQGAPWAWGAFEILAAHAHQP